MAFQRNRPATNPTRRAMSISNMTHPISKENQKALQLLDELDKKKNKKRLI